MSEIKSRQSRIVLASILVASLLVFATQWLWLWQARPLALSPRMFGLLFLAPLAANFASLGLWRISMRHQAERCMVTAIGFWLVSTLCVVFWAAFFLLFMIRPDIAATA